MKANEINITKTFSAPRETMFKYFTNSELIEQWAFPDGMTLKLPKFETKVGGRYRYEHTSKDGTYLCEGHVTELVPNEKLIQLDEYINAPDGKRLAENLETTYMFKNAIDGTEVNVVVKGSADDKFMHECETGWTQCFEHLNELIAKETSAGFKGKDGELRPNN